MSQTHVRDYATAGSIESTLRQCAAASLILDADLATDQATVLANLATRNANLRPDLRSLYLTLIETIKIGFSLLGSTVMTGGSLATVYAAVDGTWQPGFAIPG